ncbi:hypothetical protein PAPYR_4042 [Paratrimastix pyriformis]|uniref:Uncharacterized protein n=1 Tax=Paratrimastix pyriformis TaxID=342808 RepID=A0ABQ8UNC6_9EUKA|nr:hypothetical protein PAPYR_4042 [Paratrimastix pyriformis]
MWPMLTSFWCLPLSSPSPFPTGAAFPQLLQNKPSFRMQFLRGPGTGTPPGGASPPLQKLDSASSSASGAAPPPPPHREGGLVITAIGMKLSQRDFDDDL